MRFTKIFWNWVTFAIYASFESVNAFCKYVLLNFNTWENTILWKLQRMQLQSNQITMAKSDAMTFKYISTVS